MAAAMFADLSGSYQLVQYGGHSTLETLPSVKLTLQVSADGSLSVVLKVANTLRGSVASNEDGSGRLIGLLSSTKMMGSPEESKVEADFAAGFMAGFKAALSETTLSLTADGSKGFVFGSAITGENLYGNYTLAMVNGGAPPKGCGACTLRIIPTPDDGSVSRVQVTAKIVNTMHGTLDVSANMISGSLASTMMAGDEEAMKVEHIVSSGFHKGFVIVTHGSRLQLKNAEAVLAYERTLTADELIGEYVLTAINGKDVALLTPAHLSVLRADEGKIELRFKLVNKFRGVFPVEKNTIAGPVASTQKTGGDAEMHVENLIVSGLKAGFRLIQAGKNLWLRNDTSKVFFTATGQNVFAHGSPAVKADQVIKCFPNNGNGLLFRLVDTEENTWSFYNDTTMYTITVSVVFGEGSQVEPQGSATLKEVKDGCHVIEVVVAPRATEKFIKGNVHGYTATYDAQPLGVATEASNGDHESASGSLKEL